MNDATQVGFTFDEFEPPHLNMQWIHALMQSANSSGGITLLDEVLEAPTG